MANTKIIEKEYGEIIKRLVDIISEEDLINEKNLRAWLLASDSLEKFASVAEFKIRKAAIGRIRNKALSVLKKSTNQLIVSMVEPMDN